MLTIFNINFGILETCGYNQRKNSNNKFFNNIIPVDGLKNKLHENYQLCNLLLDNTILIFLTNLSKWAYFVLILFAYESLPNHKWQFLINFKCRDRLYIIIFFQIKDLIKKQKNKCWEN